MRIKNEAENYNDPTSSTGCAIFGGTYWWIIHSGYMLYLGNKERLTFKYYML